MKKIGKIVIFILSFLFISFLFKNNLYASTDFYGQSVTILKVFGQKNYKESSRDTVTSKTIYHAAGVVVDSSTTPNKIYVADTGNNRILGFASLGTCVDNPQIKCTNELNCPMSQPCNIEGKKEADIVFGQPDFSSASCNGDNNLGLLTNPSASSLCFMPYPFAANIAESWGRLNFDVDAQGNLYVLDSYNNRVLKYNQPFYPQKTNGRGDSVADFVWGQADFNSNRVSQNNPNGLYSNSYEVTRDQTSLFTGLCDFPIFMSRGVSVDKYGNIWVADSYNGRVLRFPPDSKTANLVLGKPNFTAYNRVACQQLPGYFDRNNLCGPTLARLHPQTGELLVIDETIARNAQGNNYAFETSLIVYKPQDTNGDGKPDDFVSGQAAEREITVKQPPLTPTDPYKWDSWYDQLPYFLQSSGFIFNTYKEGEYAPGEIWLNEHQSHRTILIDLEGNIIKVLGAPKEAAVMPGVHETPAYLRAVWADFCNYSSVSKFKGLCPVWPGGSLGIDNNHNLYLTAEMAQVVRYSLPYNMYTSNGRKYLPDPNGALFLGSHLPNAVSKAKFGESGGTLAHSGQLIIKDDNRLLVWNDYLNKDTGSAADYVIGQSKPDSKEPNDDLGLGRDSFHAVDDLNRLWFFDGYGQLMVYQLPFKGNDQPLKKTIKLYWSDNHQEISYRGGRGIAFNPVDFDQDGKAIYVGDEKNNRIFRIGDYSNLDNLVVDLVIGQETIDGIKCNLTGSSGWTADGNAVPNGLCGPTDIEFDRLGNLYVVENSYEGHGNLRISVWMADKIKNAVEEKRLFPNISAEKVFTQDSLDSPAYSRSYNDRPSSPVAVAFNNKNQMVVANDGSYLGHGMRPNRHLRQLWFYNNPLLKTAGGNFVQNQKADAYLKIPMGVPAEISFDENNNLIVQDGTWARVWLVNLETDPWWINWLINPIPPKEIINHYGSNDPTTDTNNDGLVNGLDFARMLP